MKKPLLISMLLLVLALLMTSAAAETITYTGPEAMTVGATFTVKHDCGNPNAVCTVTKAATCKTDGVGSCFCDECGEAYANWTVTIASNANFHTNIHREVGKAATCTTDGHYDERCRDCAKLVNLEVETIPAKGHDWIDDSEDDLHVYKHPTCVDEGAGYYNCRRCADVKKVTIPAQGDHYLEYPIARNYKATCHYEGSVYACCMLCSYVYSETSPIDPNNHTYLVTVELTPCVGLSSKTYECLDCGYEAIVPDYTPVEGPGHEWVTISRTEATCSTTGVEKQQCSRCLSEQTLTLEKDPTNHTDIQREVGKAATCTTDGHYDERCHACAKLVNLEVETIPAKGHDWIDDSKDDMHVYEAPTCIDSGSGYYNCRRCADVKKYVYIPNLGHKWGKAVRIQECSCQQCTIDRYTCENCGITTDYKYGDYLECCWIDVRIEKVPTCSEEGVKIQVCNMCGTERTRSLEKDPTNHTDIQREVGKAATCTTDGHYDERCHACAKLVNLEVETIPAKGHDWIDDSKDDLHVYEAPTCIDSGSGYYNCRRCADVKKYVYIPNLGHKWGKAVRIQECSCQQCTIDRYTCENCGITKDYKYGDYLECCWIDVRIEKVPTCSEEGVKIQVCNMCGTERTWRLEKDPTNHTWGRFELVKEATCTTKGQKMRTCTLCGEIEYSDINIRKNNHVWSAWKTVQEATCQVGQREERTCTLCGQNEFIEWETLLEHNWIDIVLLQDATCTKDGLQRGTCSFCGLTSEIPLPATGHPSSTLVTIKEPTCTESGYSSYLCDVCGESTSDSDRGLLPLGHDWTEWVIVEATCASPKYTERTCERCGISERTEEGEPLDHIWAVADIIQDATCTAPGVALMSCTLCGQESEMPIPQLDHILTVVPSVPATATTRGSTYGIVCELCGYWEKEPHPIDMVDVFADVTVILKGDDIGTIYDKDGNVIGQDPELCAFILDLVAKSGSDESVDYVTVYRGADGVMYAYVDSNGDMYAGFDDDYMLLFNIADLHPDTAE